MARTAQDRYLDGLISHAIHLERLKAGTVSRLIANLNRAEKDLVKQLRDGLDKLGEVGRTATPAKIRRLDALIRRVREIRTAAWGVLGKDLQGELLDLAEYEAEFNDRLMHESIGIQFETDLPTAANLRAVVTSRPFQGKILRDFAKDLERADLTRLSDTIRLGAIEGLTNQQIVQRVAGTRAAKYRDGILEISRRNADAVVRTAMNHVANGAREELWKANADIIDGLVWVSVLDGRTTAICMARDGKLAPLPGQKLTLPEGKERLIPAGARPPAHYRCRSMMVAFFSAAGILGNRPFVTDTRTPKHRKIDFRKQAQAAAGSRWSSLSRQQRNKLIAQQRTAWGEANIGRVPAETTYGEFLGRQSVSFQTEVLGRTRSKLFREGGLTLDKFVDVSGRQYTIDQLRIREAAAFERAGLAE